MYNRRIDLINFASWSFLVSGITTDPHTADLLAKKYVDLYLKEL